MMVGKETDAMEIKRSIHTHRNSVRRKGVTVEVFIFTTPLVSRRRQICQIVAAQIKKIGAGN